MKEGFLKWTWIGTCVFLGVLGLLPDADADATSHEGPFYSRNGRYILRGLSDGFWSNVHHVPFSFGKDFGADTFVFLNSGHLDVIWYPRENGRTLEEKLHVFVERTLSRTHRNPTIDHELKAFSHAGVHPTQLAGHPAVMTEYVVEISEGTIKNVRLIFADAFDRSIVLRMHAFRQGVRESEGSEGKARLYPEALTLFNTFLKAFRFQGEPDCPEGPGI